MPFPGTLTSDWLRARAGGPFRVPATREADSESAAIAAAVLIPVVERPTGLTVLLTQRTAHLRDHAGQISFPGGRCEPEDDSPVATALRESLEEVGLLPRQVDVLAILPEHSTSTGFRITPVLGLVQPPLNLQLDDFEVAEVIEPPLAFFLEEENYHTDTRVYRGADRTFWAVPWEGYYIWGATASMLRTLRQCLLECD